jgi:hypothetical protein
MCDGASFQEERLRRRKGGRDAAVSFRLPFALSCCLPKALRRTIPIGRCDFVLVMRPEISDPVPVTAGEDGIVFRSAAGQGFVLADVVTPGGTDQDTTTVQRSSEAAGSRYMAYRAGPENRWGLAPAWVVSERGTDRVLVQQELLSSGMSLVAPTLERLTVRRR